MSDRFHAILWPGVVVSLLVGSVVMMTFVLFAARSDGGAQVVEDYYAQSVSWDSTASERAVSKARNWTLDVSIGPHREALLTVSDSTDAPVLNLLGTVSIRRPHLAAELGEVSLSPSRERPGAYKFNFDHSGPGIWIFDVRLNRPGIVHVATIRKRVLVE